MKECANVKMSRAADNNAFAFRIHWSINAVVSPIIKFGREKIAVKFYYCLGLQDSARVKYLFHITLIEVCVTCPFNILVAGGVRCVTSRRIFG